MNTAAAVLPLLVSLAAPAVQAAGPPSSQGEEAPVLPEVQHDAELPSETEALRSRVAALEARLEALEAGAVARTTPPATSARLDRARAETQGPVPSPGLGASVALGGAEVASGAVVAEAVSLAGPLDVYGRVTGNAVAVAGPVRVHSGAEVLGDAVSVVGPIEVAEGGVVVGEQVSLGSAVAGALLEEGTPQMAGLLARAARRVAALLSLAATGVLLLAFWPRQIGRIATVAMERPLWHGVAGLVLSLVALVTGLFLTVTLIGIPVAGLLALVVSSAWLLGFVALCFAIGDRIAPSPTHSVHWRTFLVGIVLVAALSLVPIFGPLVLALLGLVSIGAACVSRFGNRMDPDAP